MSEYNLPAGTTARHRLLELAATPMEGSVGLLTFKDSAGVRWRVWRVETPAARAHLMEPSYRDGWLVFEREDGSERRRLQRAPDDWMALPPDRLATLCETATPVRLSPTGSQPITPRPGTRTDR